MPAILGGVLLAKGRRTVTSWFRPAGITTDFRNAYAAVNAIGRRAPCVAFGVFGAVRPLLGNRRLLVAFDDTPTRRRGPEVEGPASTGTPAPAPPTAPSSTATSSSPRPPWPATRATAPSPCP